MIVLNLSCAAGHQFEGWFASSEAFDQQVANQLVECPHCACTEIKRLPSRLNIAHASSVAPADATAPLAAQELLNVLQQLSAASEDVGERFPEEARRIHYREVEARSIKGQASLSEMNDLLDEGIAILPVPKKSATH